MGAGIALLLILLVALIVIPRVLSQRETARALLSDGFVAMNNGNYVAALSTFDQIMTKHRLSGLADEATVYKAAALVGLDNCGEAVPLFERFRQEEPRHDLAALAVAGIATCAEIEGDYARSAGLYEGLVGGGSHEYLGNTARFRLARLARETGNADAALNYYKELRETNEDNLWAELARGRQRLLTSREEPAAPSSSAEE